MKTAMPRCLHPAGCCQRGKQSRFSLLVKNQKSAQGKTSMKKSAKKTAPEDAGDSYNELGHLVRQLHETLRDLGCDEAMRDAVGELPDTQDRLNYIAQLTEQAAQRTLSAVEAALPLQNTLESEALALSAAWRAAKASGNGDWQAVAEKMHQFLETVPGHARQTAEQLNDIMMAQDFQDLTGQVIKKVTHLTQNLEQQLVHILVLSKPGASPERTGDPMLNGPVIKKEGRADIVKDQTEVDDLLNSLGF
jgi:chemotaxis protein CheZ